METNQERAQPNGNDIDRCCGEDQEVRTVLSFGVGLEWVRDRELANVEDDSRVWEREMAEQIEEEKEYYEKNYQREMRLYGEQRALFEKQRDLKVE